MHILNTALAGVAVIETDYRNDERGAFARWFCESKLAPLLGNRRVVQTNFSRTMQRGALRGMHYQKPPHAEMKLIRCIRGAVLDVALDLRAGSPTFMQWHAEELSAENGRMIVVPEGCAHGFQVLAPESELLYLHTAAYAPQSEGAVRYDDPAAAITWPLAVTEISQRDLSHPLLSADFPGILL